jgi:hypothetical protein
MRIKVNKMLGMAIMFEPDELGLAARAARYLAHAFREEEPEASAVFEEAAKEAESANTGNA